MGERDAIPAGGADDSAATDPRGAPRTTPPATSGAPVEPTESAAPTETSESSKSGEPASARREVGRSAVGLVIAAGILPLASLATGPLLARFLGPEDRGYLSAILAPVNLIPYLLAIGLADAATYLVARRKQSPATVGLALGTLEAVAGVLGFVGIWFLAPVIMAGYEPGVVLLRIVAITVIPAMAIRALGGARMGEGRYDLLIRERWIAGLGRLLLLVGLAVCGALTVTTAAWTQVGVLLLGQLAMFVGLTRVRTSWRHMRALGYAGYTYGLRSWGGELAVILATRLDQVVLLPLAGAAQLGYYAIAVSLAEIPKLLFGDLRVMLLSEVAAKRDVHAAARACRMVITALVLPVAGLMAITPLALPLLFGEDFSPAVPMAEVLLIATIPAGVNFFTASAISALGRPGLQSWAQATGVVVTVVGVFALAPVLGGMGAAWTALAASLTTTVALTFAFCRASGLGPSHLLVPRISDVSTLLRRVLRRG